MVLVLLFVIQYFVSIYFCKTFDGEERTGCFALNVFLVSCDSQCLVALPHGDVVSLLCVIVVFDFGLLVQQMMFKGLFYIISSSRTALCTFD